MKCDFFQVHCFNSHETVQSLNSIGSGRDIYLIDNSMTGEMKRYARRNDRHIIWIRPNVKYRAIHPTHSAELLSLPDAWNLALSSVQTPWAVNVNPDVMLNVGSVEVIEKAVDRAIDAGAVVAVSTLGFNIWACDVKAILGLGGFDSRFWPCAGEEEDLLIRIGQSGLKWGRFNVGAYHVDGGHLSRSDGGRNVETFRAKWGFHPHSEEYKAIVQQVGL